MSVIKLNSVKDTDSLKSRRAKVDSLILSNLFSDGFCDSETIEKNSKKLCEELAKIYGTECESVEIHFLPHYCGENIPPDTIKLGVPVGLPLEEVERLALLEVSKHMVKYVQIQRDNEPWHRII